MSGSKAKRAGLVGALVGVAAAGVAGGIAVQRLVLRRAEVADRYAAEPFDALPFTTARTVTTGDGVDLHVEVVEPDEPAVPTGPDETTAADGPVAAYGADGPDETLTVIFVHGLALDMGTFHFQRRELTGCGLRLVFYDQPGHGASGRPPAGRYRLDALGEALHAVIRQVAPTGPLALVGHSMGGMTIMALADRYPELIAERVRAVALISTSAGHLSDVPLGMPRVLAGARQRVLVPVLSGAARLTPAMIDRVRGSAGDVGYLLTRRYGFGGRPPSPAVVRYVERMNARIPIDVVTGYFGTIFEHQRYAALGALAATDVLIVAGDADLFTPLSHAERIHRLLPDAALVVVPEAGHMALLEYPEVVGPPLRKLLDRAAGGQRADS